MFRSVVLPLSFFVACGSPEAVPDAAVEPADAAPDMTPDACALMEPGANDCSDPCFDADGPRLVMEIMPSELALAQPDPASRAIKVALFLGIAPQPPNPLNRWTRDEAIERWASLIRDTNVIFAQCQMHLEVEAVQVVALPSRLLYSLQANEPSSFGGHPPPGTPNPDLFDYNQNERLTAESLELYGYGKQYSSKNALSVFSVQGIVYYSNQMMSSAGGLSNPPNIYHHPDDYPYRNSVLVVPEYGQCGDIPRRMAPATLGQEVGHMLLNTGGHVETSGNLMNDGTRITPEQCQLMTENLTRLFGETEVPDPGPPA